MEQQNKDSLKLVSWNVNGLRAALKKNFMEVFAAMDADVFCVQETKLQEHQLDPAVKEIPGYRSYWSHCTVKKGYSGVAAWSKPVPEAVHYGIGIPDYDAEGRILGIDLGSFLLFNIYFPNGQMSEERLSYKLEFYRDFFAYAAEFKRAGRSLVITGDYNTAHHEIDLKNPRANAKTSGFLRVERDWLDAIEAEGYVDTFRFLYPERVQYSWWSYRSRARERNAGWRIDYFFVTRDMITNGRIREAFIADDITGSDHCPVGLIVKQ
ncbi:MAG TPA: exodeoxyribonuclease III [Desulfosalsimonadaceae bacterium]|nr:exodeoxyribonuclease III [Desulfosalsimonadaceae bacterium]